MRPVMLAAIAALFGASSGAAQEAPTAATAEPVVAIPVPPPPPAPTTLLPARTEIVLNLTEELTSRRHRQGQTFDLTVATHVTLGNYIVIPAGTRAVGEITWLTGRGILGKSGKMDIAIRYIDLNGRHIPVEGTFRQEGEGNTVATMAAAVVVPVAALFVTGRSAVIPAGRQLTVRLRDNLPVILPDQSGAAPQQPTTQQPQ